MLAKHPAHSHEVTIQEAKVFSNHPVSFSEHNPATRQIFLLHSPSSLFWSFSLSVLLNAYNHALTQTGWQTRRPTEQKERDKHKYEQADTHAHANARTRPRTHALACTHKNAKIPLLWLRPCGNTSQDPESTLAHTVIHGREFYKQCAVQKKQANLPWSCA